MYINLNFFCFFFSSRRRHTRWPRDWSSDVCSSDLVGLPSGAGEVHLRDGQVGGDRDDFEGALDVVEVAADLAESDPLILGSTRRLEDGVEASVPGQQAGRELRPHASNPRQAVGGIATQHGEVAIGPTRDLVLGLDELLRS